MKIFYALLTLIILQFPTVAQIPDNAEHEFIVEKRYNAATDTYINRMLTEQIIVRDTLDDNDESKTINEDFLGHIETIRAKIESNKAELIEQGKTTSRSMGFILSSVLGKLSSITYSIIIFALILAGLLVVMVAS